MELKMKLDALTKKVDALVIGKSINTVNSFHVDCCSICASPIHSAQTCPSLPTFVESSMEHVNAFNDFRKQSNGPFSDTYNPGWRNHHNFSAIAKMETQIGQIANHLGEREKGKLPSQPLPNPRLQFQGEVHPMLCRGKNMFKPLSHLGQEDKWTTKWFFLKRTLLHSKSKEVAALRKKMRSHLQPLLRPLLGRLYLRRSTLTDYLRPIKEGSSRTFWRKTNVPKKVCLTEHVSSILQCKLPIKHRDLGCPTISCMIRVSRIEKALLDLGASINLLPYSVYLQLGLGELKPTSMTLQLADWSVKVPRGIIEDVLIMVNRLLPRGFHSARYRASPECGDSNTGDSRASFLIHG
ncbi:uncharacterized protein LOC133873227 [Alnus glutinosa]|uniref:uncharacterized protein LOC133873227 n=1 Tax=Alnus glutinosa TaxID=3517 RepID=UPI002D767308|nr:uncharacterized protein LOC133873227 [Alnus glutinosa]